MPQDPIRNLNGLTERICQSLENIGIKYMLQLVTMTQSQVFCIKGIDNPEISVILTSLAKEDMSLAIKPLEFVIEPMGYDKIASGRKEIPAKSLGYKDYDPSNDPRLKDVNMGIHLNPDLGVVEFVFPVPMLKVQFKPHNALAVANIISQKAQSLLLMDGSGSDKIM